MRERQSLALAVLFVFCICPAGILDATEATTAPAPRAEEWQELPTIINIVDNTNPGDINQVVLEANKILAKAKKRLVVKDVNKVNVGNGNDRLTYEERRELRRQGMKELYKRYGGSPRPGDPNYIDPNGIKITIATDCNVLKPSVNGVAVHDLPVVIIEPDANSKKAGRTLAHEVSHVLTLNYDLYDPNDINRMMYGYSNGGTDFTPAEINEMTRAAKKRGKNIIVMPKPMPGQSIAVPDGVQFVVKGKGAALDEFYDISCGAPGFDPCNPNFEYADMREIILFWDRPFDPDSDISLDIQLGGYYPPTSSFDMFINAQIDRDSDPDIDASISMHIWGTGNYHNAYANFYDYETSQSHPLEMATRLNNISYESDTSEPYHHTLEITIPADFFLPGSNPFEGTVTFNMNTTDSRLGSYPMNDHLDSPLYFGLTRPVNGPALDVVRTYGGGGSGGPILVFGRGFSPDASVDVLLNDEIVTTVQTGADGSVQVSLPGLVDKTAYRCDLVSRTAEPGNPDAVHWATATGYFTNCQAGSVDSDLDNDCDVDLFDFASLADNWLFGD